MRWLVPVLFLLAACGSREAPEPTGPIRLEVVTRAPYTAYGTYTYTVEPGPEGGYVWRAGIRADLDHPERRPAATNRKGSLSDEQVETLAKRMSEAGFWELPEQVKGEGSILHTVRLRQGERDHQVAVTGDAPVMDLLEGSFEGTAFREITRQTRAEAEAETLRRQRAGIPAEEPLTYPRPTQ